MVRTDRSRCSRRSSGRSPRRSGSPGVVAWSIPRQVSSSSRDPRPGADPGPCAGAPPASEPSVTGPEPEPSRPSEKRGGSRPLCYRAARHADQPRAAAAPSAQPRPRAAPRLFRRPKSRHCDPDPPVHGLPRGRPGGRHRRCRRLQLLQPGLAGSARHPEQPDVRPADRRVRPGQQGQAGEPRRVQARGRRLRRHPGRGPRCNHRDRGQGLLVQPRLRRRGLHRGHGGHAGRPAPRRLDDHPAAGPRPPPARERLRGQPRGAQDPRDHPVPAPDRGLPGPGRQAGDHHGLSEPELLRQPVVRDQGGRADLLQQEPREPDPRPGRPARSDPPVADPLRPRQERRGPLLGRGQGRRRVPGGEDAARRPGHVRDRHSPQLRPRPDEDAQPALGRQAHRRRIRSGQERAGRARTAARGHLACPAFRVAGSGPARHDPLPGRRGRPVRRHRHGRLPGPDDPRLDDAGEDREVAVCRRADPQRLRHERPHSRPAEGPQDPVEGLGLDGQPARQEHPQRRCRGPRLPDRRGPRVWRLGELHGQGQERSSSRSSTSCPTAGASPDPRSSRSTMRSGSRTGR